MCPRVHRAVVKLEVQIHERVQIMQRWRSLLVAWIDVEIGAPINDADQHSAKGFKHFRVVSRVQRSFFGG